tara:strand:+ start:575 stop:826 length:252 start_codon:yes stop_codon:yes gene_type:complete
MQNLQKIIGQGHDAERLLKDELLIESFNAVEQSYIRRWMSADNVDEREKLHALITALQDVHTHLEEIVQSGVLAEEQLRISRS